MLPGTIHFSSCSVWIQFYSKLLNWIGKHWECIIALMYLKIPSGRFLSVVLFFLCLNIWIHIDTHVDRFVLRRKSRINKNANIVLFFLKVELPDTNVSCSCALKGFKSQPHTLVRRILDMLECHEADSKWTQRSIRRRMWKLSCCVKLYINIILPSEAQTPDWTNREKTTFEWIETVKNIFIHVQTFTVLDF